MIHSMTGFGMAQTTCAFGSVTVEIRSVNSRYLDIQFRLPDELRMTEQPLRELISRQIKRGKVDIRASFVRTASDAQERLNDQVIAEAVAVFAKLKLSIPDLTAPSFNDVWNWPNAARSSIDPMLWVTPTVEACHQALEQTNETRAREGDRLVQVMREMAEQAKQIALDLKGHMPNLLMNQREKSTLKLREALEQSAPQGFSQISGEELSARLATEASLFSMRVDVAEELDRLNAHLQELEHLMVAETKHQSLGKRLDFLFQEMNREANTLGSKSGHLQMTRTAIDLKLLIEQMREQAQNIE